MKQETRRRHSPVVPAVFLMLLLLAIAVAGIFWGFGDVLRPSEPDAPETSMDGSDTQQAQEPAPAPQPEETENPEPSEEEEVPTEQVSTEQETPDPAQPDSEDPWYLTLVNRWNPLPEDFTIDLVEVPGGQQVDARIYEPLMEMLDAATEAELGPIVVSGFRTREKQQSIYDEKVQSYLDEGYSQEEAVALAEEWVALPGTSEHELGLAVDINGAVYAIYPWLQEHSYEYGFIFRYPEDKQDLTGVAEEVWHYRYVGKEAAQAIHDQGICLEEYLANGIPSVSP